MAGQYDLLSQRVDLETGEVVDYRLPQPSDDHVWNETTRRWVLSEEAQQHEWKDALARRRIAELDAQSIRPLRELSVDPANEDARARLETIEAEIAALRAHLKT